MALIERGPQLAALSQYLEDTRDGSGVLVLVAGEAGSGKSALVSDFLADVAVRVVAGSCDGLSTPRPLGPLIDIAAQLEVDAMLPRDQLFAAILDALARQSTIALVEDLHWADDATADFLLYAGRRLDDLPAMLIATYRDDEIRSNATLTRSIGEFARLGVARRVSVGSLSESGVAALVAGSGLDPAEVFRQTSGNPFFVTECLAAGSSTPGTIRDAVLARAALLPVHGRRVLEVASQLGLRFEADLLIEAGGADAGGVDDCVAQGMLMTFGTELGFRHELSRATIADEIPPIRRATVNRAILRALEQRRGIDVARLAGHAAAAYETERAFRYGLRAAQRAADLGAHREAVHHYRTALRFASPQPASERATLLGALAAECMVTDQMDEALTAAEESLQLWNEIGDPIKVGAAHIALEYIAWYLGRGDLALQHASDAVAVLEPHGPTVELGRALTGAGTFEVDTADPQHGIVTLRRALEIATSTGDPYGQSNTLNSIGWALAYYYGDVDSAVTHLEQSLQDALKYGFGHLSGRAYANLATVLVDNDRFDSADTVIADGLRHAEDHDLTLRWVCITSVLADVELRRGRWDDALADAWGVLQRAGTMAVGHIPALTTIGTITMRRGEPDAHSTLLEALQRAESAEDMQRIVPVTLALAEEAWLHRDLHSARSSIRNALSRNDKPLTVHHRGHLTSWATRLGDPHDVPAGTPSQIALEINGEWQQAAAAWCTLERPYEQALALIEVGTPTALTQAFDILDRLGARPAATLAAERLRSLGERVPRGLRPSTRGNPAGLTSREVEVLQLVADGLTNAEIGARLFVSDKTVEHHVSRILGKLGVPNRREAAKTAQQLDLPTT
ncbi:helix-turn-helix transcriptional regulator [Kribbella sp. NBC_00359]|uniref:helix-turn-helix transcriptional regulator n=1 Tax=Kribbella sp. NBC_00359 TaxID=2975966 RepID=UPI002E2368FE